ncbi:LysR family transcriptional regulator [Falsirhodobacter halotolerans]|uniref:LysR family transcriptional regulator n=1 Tax=Falsirhodobacter halotolerans TaxID=1146892 RepID=UPI001FD2E912|nr:LysR family transcriptional regulator [Falsirhodobacter halotolerans]MCJ8141129.1 LysR family transcriptional regulator [Falsirhodobacter halotolerans]
MDPNYLETKQLEAFIAVISIGSMTGAARALGRSQSVITRLIQELEEEVGFPLLHRNGPRITPTQQGLAFHAQAEMFLAGLRTIGARARAIADAPPLPLHIAALPSLASSVVPAALARLTEAQRPAHVHLNSVSAENVIQSTAGHIADLGLSTLPLDHPGVEVHWSAEVPCVAVVAATHPLARRDRIDVADFRDATLIASHNPYRIRHAINAALDAGGIRPPRSIDSNASSVSVALARQGLGIAVVESMTLRGLPVDGVVSVPLGFALPYRWGAITPAGRPLAPATALLIDLIRTIAEGLPRP